MPLLRLFSYRFVIHRHQTASGAQDRGRQTCIQSWCRMMHCKSNCDSEPVANKSDSNIVNDIFPPPILPSIYLYLHDSIYMNHYLFIP